MRVTVIIYDKDHNIYDSFNNINKITYTVPWYQPKKIEVEGDELLTHEFPTNYDLHLFSPNSSYTINRHLLYDIRIVKD